MLFFMVDYGGKYAIDVGWYSSFKKGFFRIVIVQDGDWENPFLYDKKCRALKTLNNQYMEECVEMIKDLLEE